MPHKFAGDFEKDLKCFRNINRFSDLKRKIIDSSTVKSFTRIGDHEFYFKVHGVPDELISDYKRLKDETSEDRNIISEEKKFYFFIAYRNGLGYRNNSTYCPVPSTKFENGVIEYFPLSSDERKNALVKQGIEELINTYEIPVKFVQGGKKEELKRFMDEEKTNEDDLFYGLESVGDLSQNLRIYTTDIRGLVSRDNTVPEGKNPEDFYGCGNAHAIVMVLGGGKDLSDEAIIKGARHEFIHMIKGGGRHHDDRKYYKNFSLFNQDESCVFASNMALDRRSSDPCSFLDYEIRMRVQGFKDRMELK